MKIRSIIFGIIASAAIFPVHAQTVDEIINKNTEARGGKDKINSIQTIHLESSVEVMGNDATSSTFIVNGKGYKNMLNFNGQQIIQCVTDKGGWSVNPLMGQTRPQALSADQIKAAQSQLDLSGPLVDYAAKGNKVELAGKEVVNGASAYNLKVTTKDNIPLNLYIDSASSNLVKFTSSMNMGGQQMETTITFSDYRKTESGYVFAYAQQITLPQVTLNITHNKVEINGTIDPTVFDMPK
ncbi:MAG: hypothetical protein P4L51_27110 [Puia sp.]|nr:hypothetical protein [Puia sp.]